MSMALHENEMRMVSTRMLGDAKMLSTSCVCHGSDELLYVVLWRV